jgi:hypothetical protein
MTTLLEAPRRELANRSCDGLDITLAWTRNHGEDEVVVCVLDERDGTYFEIQTDPPRALCVYHHPFAYRGSTQSTTKTADSPPTARARRASLFIKRMVKSRPPFSRTDPQAVSEQSR